MASREVSDAQVWVAFEADVVAGFVVVKLHGNDNCGWAILMAQVHQCRSARHKPKRDRG